MQLRGPGVCHRTRRVAGRLERVRVADISSLARECATHISRDLRSIGLSFQRRFGTDGRFWKRRRIVSILLPYAARDAGLTTVSQPLEGD